MNKIGEHYYYPIERINEIQQVYSERIKHASTTLLSINMISKKYEHIVTISFDTQNIGCETYAVNQINNPCEEENCYWLSPILVALKEKGQFIKKLFYCYTNIVLQAFLLIC